MKHLLYSIVFLVYTFGYSQDSLAYHQNKRQDPVSKHSQDSLQRIKTQAKDTIDTTSAAAAVGAKAAPVGLLS